MTPRNTNTGGVLEAMILPALARGGYSYQKQVRVGQRCGGGNHKVDAIATKSDEKILVSLKWQQTGGTAEQKVPFEVMCLADAVRAQHAARAYLVLGGDGWTLRDYYTSGALSEHLVYAQLVRVVTLEAFVRLANNGQI
ncbi:MAG TPA: PD-(D/E)XK nuclease superfamily protein [Vicinamibacterales bacterium]|nr:PD-(D/E)XK nuclease superfamily protein [Vicinamibacterales bacterium]